MSRENLEPTVMGELMDIQHLAKSGYFVALNDDDCDRYQLSTQFNVIAQKVKQLEDMLEDRNVKITPLR